ncbi:MAG: hypothetical protein H6739_14255 [Alphaproteobacteria bacterium]|nr:hypothetical protein [Alphaproteobacteria bacterium]
MPGVTLHYGEGATELVPRIELDEWDPPPDALAMIPRDLALALRVLPVVRSDETLVLAISTRSVPGACVALEAMLSLDIAPVEADADKIESMLARLF